MYVIKTDLDGNLLWERTYGKDITDPYFEESEAFDMVETDAGDLIVVGQISQHDVSAPFSRNFETFRIKVSGSTGNMLVAGQITGGNINFQSFSGIIQDQSNPTEFVTAAWCETSIIGQFDIMLRRIDQNLNQVGALSIINPVYSEPPSINWTGGSGEYQSFKIEFRPSRGGATTDEFIIGVKGKDAPSGVSKGFVIRCDNSMNHLQTLYIGNIHTFDLRVDPTILSTTGKDIAIASSTVEGIPNHTTETYTCRFFIPSNPFIYKCCQATSPYTMPDEQATNYGADALIVVTKNDPDPVTGNLVIDWRSNYEHTGPFGECQPQNVKQQECYVSIVETVDGGLIACGNDSRNFDDVTVLKVTKGCYDGLIDYDYSCELSACNLTGTQTITGDKVVKGKVVVKTGANITINGGTWRFDVTFPSGIVVEPGGVLTITGGAILTSLCEKDFWGGIEVWGNKLLSQTGANQGTLIMDDATVQNAYRAIRVYDETNYTTTGGGILNISNSTFRNNRVSIHFYDYSQESISMVTDCIFECTDLLAQKNVGKGSLNFITLEAHRGVVIQGNIFRNTVLKGVLNDFHRGTGIIGVNSAFTACRDYIYPYTPPPSCDVPPGEPNKFYNLSFGILAYGDLGSPNKKIKILENEFYNVTHAISLAGTTYPMIWKNKIEWNADYIGDDNYDETFGIRLNKCRSFLVEQNDIQWYDQTGKINVGISISNSNIDHFDPAFVFSNNIKDHQSGLPTSPNTTIGTALYGNCVALMLECNTYEGMMYGWTVSTQHPNLGTAHFQNQGDAMNPSGNQFLDVCGSGALKYNITTAEAIFKVGIDVVYPNNLASCVYVNVIPDPSGTNHPCTLTNACAAYFQDLTVVPGSQYTGDPGDVLFVSPDAPTTPKYDKYNYRRGQIEAWASQTLVDDVYYDTLGLAHESMDRIRKRIASELLGIAHIPTPQSAILDKNTTRQTTVEEKVKPSLKAIPNPSSNYFVAQFSGIETNQTYTLNVYSTLGIKVYSANNLNVSVGTHTVNTQSFPSGMYFMTLENTTGVIAYEKILVNFGK